MSGARVLVLGVTGMLGHKVFQRLRESSPGVVGQARGKAERDPLATIPLLAGADVRWGVDVGDLEGLGRLLHELRPAVVVNCAGIVKQRSEAKAAVPSITVNSLLPHWLAERVEPWGGRLIHFSTDCVFDGRKGSYEESDRPNAEDLYGRTKALGEVDARNALTLRTSIIGRELRGRRSLIEWFLGNQGGKVRGYKRVVYSGLTTIEMARLVERLVAREDPLAGVYHVASEPISKCDLLTIVDKAFASGVEIEPEWNTVLDRSLRGERFCAASGWVSPSWQRMIAEMAADPTPYADWQKVAAGADAGKGE